jgi:hypothetical protein
MGDGGNVWNQNKDWIAAEFDQAIQKRIKDTKQRMTFHGIIEDIILGRKLSGPAAAGDSVASVI